MTEVLSIDKRSLNRVKPGRATLTDDKGCQMRTHEISKFMAHQVVQVPYER